MIAQCIRPAVFQLSQNEDNPTFTERMSRTVWQPLHEVVQCMRTKTGRKDMTEQDLVMGFGSMNGHFYGKVVVTLVGISTDKGIIAHADRELKNFQLRDGYDYYIPEVWGSRMLNPRYDLQDVHRVNPRFTGQGENTVLVKVECLNAAGVCIRHLVGDACPWLAPPIRK